MSASDTARLRKSNPYSYTQNVAGSNGLVAENADACLRGREKASVRGSHWRVLGTFPPAPQMVVFLLVSLYCTSTKRGYH